MEINKLVKRSWMVVSFVTVLMIGLAGYTHADSLLVSSYGSNSILQYDATTGAFEGAFVPSGTGGLGSPDGIVFGPDGNLYVANSDGAPAEVLRYNGQTGAFMGAFVPTGTGAAFTDAIFGANGNLFVSDFNAHNVKEYNGTTGAFIGVFASTNLINPQDLVFGPDGNLYVADEVNVDEFNGATEAFIKTFVANPSAVPEGLTFGPDGNLYVGSALGDGILEYDGTNGAFIKTFIPGGSGGLGQAHHLSFEPNGEVYVANTTGNDILTYNANTGSFISALVTPDSGGLSEPVNFTFSAPPASTVPEPSTLVLFGLAVVAIAVMLRRDRATATGN